MAAVTVKHIDELGSYAGRGTFMFARTGMGVSAFGVNLGRRPAGYESHPVHLHSKDGR